jgi:hypothetical protein
MKIHKAITKESLRMTLDALMESGNDDAPTLAIPGTYHGRPAVIIAVHTDQGKEMVFLPLAVVLDPESDDAAYLTMDGVTMRGPGAPSVPSVADSAALAVLRDVAAAGGVLAERAQRILAGRPVAPAAPIERVGVYL